MNTPVKERRPPTLPVSFAQQRLWFLAQLDSRASAAYHMPGAVRLRGVLDRSALQAALDRIVERHEILRTCLVTKNGQPRQKILQQASFPLVHEDLSARPQPQAEAERMARHEADLPFDLKRGPLVRGQLLRLADEDYVLLVTMHHVVSDGWSMGIFLNELSSLYAAFSVGAPDPLPPLAIQYADYAIGQRERLTGELLQRQTEFWRTTLAAPPTILELPTDRPRPPVQDYAGARLPFELDAELSAKVAAWSRRHRCTLFMTLLTAWAALLSRLSGQRDLVIGTPMAGRTRPEIEPLIGFFVNTLALRIDLGGAPTAAELLHRVRHTTLAAQEHQDLPFEQVIEAVQPVRSLAHNPLFQVMFTLENASGDGGLEMPGLDMEPVHQDVSTAEFDLALSMTEGAGRIAGHFTYATALFDRATIARHIGHFITLLRAMATDDAHAVEHLPLLSRDERVQVLQEWNATEAPFPAERCIHELFEAQAQHTPDAPAVVFEDGTLSYAQLDAQANGLAHSMIARGVRPGSLVALALPRSVELVAAELAVLKCGAAYVPLDIDHPAERLRFMLADCQAHLLVCRRDCVLDAPPRLEIDRLDADGACVHPGVKVHAEDAAYVMYTSGSTGTPKGVVVPHRAVLNLALQSFGDAAIGSDDRVAFASNPAFDSSTLELWGALLHGAAVVVVPQPVLLDPQALAERLRRERVTVLILVAGVLRAYAPVLAGRLSTVRTLVTGGDVADPHALATLLGEGGPQQVLQTYGPTETTQFVTTLALREPPAPGARIPIGRPIANARIYVLDARGQPVPVGVAGEIHIGGAGMAHGYLNRAQLTAERFVPDPFAAQPGARMYKTGDLGRWRIDPHGAGTIEFLGRNDAQVKIRGFRIEPREIEVRLLQHPQVREAVVLAREDSPGDKRLVAYLIAEDSLPPEALRAHLAALLPEYMVPAAYVRLDALPLTPNGKLDRRALPAPEEGAFGPRTDEPPQGELECTLAALWRELLGRASIGRRDDFFVLGGHSLLAAQLASRIRVRLGLEVPLAELFAHPTLAGFAERVAAAGASTLPAIVPASRSEPLPLSFAQQRLWFIGQQERARAAYVIPAGVRLLGTLDVPAVQAALDRIVSRHEALRTAFEVVDGMPVQIIATPDVGFALEHVDLSTHAQPEAHAERIAAEEVAAPFDLARGPLIRGRLLRLGDQDHVLLVTMHHIVSDAWSSGVLINEFSTLYTALSQSRPDPLPPLTIQYADYAVWQRRWISGELLQRQLAFWRAHLTGAPARLELPTDRPRPAVQDHAGSSIDFELDAELSAGLKALGRRHGTTLFMTLIASWAALLARLSGQAEVVIGTPVAHRTRAELEPLIGFFVNSLALRIDLSAHPTVAELLAQVRATALAAQAHQDIPFEQVVEALNPVRSLAHGPVFQVMFAWQNAPEGALELPGLQLEPVGAPSTSVQFELEVSMHEAGERIGGSLGYASALFDATTIERHLALWQTLLRAMAADDTARVPRLPLLGDAERHQLLHGWNATETVFPKLCLHELFESQAARTPGAVAAVFEGTSLSYAELNARANRLAHHLRRLGVVPDTRVAICVERGMPMVVGLLAILKAGGAYVPLDPDYPTERLAYMLADSRPAALLTDAAGAARLPAHGIPMCRLDQDEPLWAGLPADNLPAHALGLSPRHLAYMIYTSGSTGSPKGAMNEHGAVVNRLWWMQQAYGLGAADAVLQKTPFGFDVSVWEFFWTWLAGARLVLARPQGQRDAHYLTALIEREQITTLHFVPSMLSAFLSALPAGGCASLQRIVCSGEALGEREVRAVHERLSQARLVNLYGPTEAAVDVTACEPQPGAPVTIGSPIANTRMYILDAHGAPVPVGVAGELHIGGVQVGRGYLDRPQLTAERFVPDPFAPDAGSRMYRTGDLGRWLIDANGHGTIEFLGRSDQQVKIRGFRIELGEIEARLLQHSAVREAVVLAREDSPGAKRLVAYVVGDGSLQPEALRIHLEAGLPEHMVPAAYVQLDALPLTPNGKLDRRALPMPEDSAFSSRAYEAPQGELETTLAAIWAERLGVERVGRHDNFFQLGGHSLMVIALLERMRDAGLQAEVQTLFAAPTLAGFARHVGFGTVTVPVPPNRITPALRELTPELLLPLAHVSASGIRRIVESVPGGLGNIQDIYGLSPLQEGMLFHHVLDPQGDPYVSVHEMSFAGRAPLQRYLDALQAVIDRHDVLRTSVLWEELEEPVQVVWRRAPLSVAEMTLSGEEGPASEQLARRCDPQHWHLDLSRAPLLDTVIAQDPHSGRWLLRILFHHLVDDNSTLEILHQEILVHLAGKQSQLSPPIPFRNLVAHARLGIPQEEHERLFRSMLADVEQPCAPFGLLDVRGQGREVREAHDELDPALTARLRAAARQLGVSLAALFHLAWAQVVARTSGSHDAVFGTVLFGRMHAAAGVQRSVGLFINMLPLRLRIDATPVAEAAQATHRLLAQLMRHEHASLALAQRCSGVPAPQPLFTSLLNYRHRPLQASENDLARQAERDVDADPSLQDMEFVQARERTNYPVSMSVDDLGDAVGLAAQAISPLAPERLCAFMRTALQQLADALDHAPHTPLATLDVLPPEERRQLLHEWNATEAPLPAEHCIHALLEQQAAHSPDAVAITHEDRQLSYAGLNAEANRLAHHLRSLGVKPDSRVAMCVERGLHMVVGLLAVLKAGGACVPLDPMYPAERLAFMLHDSQPTAVLTDPRNVAALKAIAPPCPMVDLIADASRWAGASDQNPRAGLTPSDLAYVIYTSGSTGTPKGVQVANAGLINYGLAAMAAYGVGPSDRVLQCRSVSFDVVMDEVFSTLCAGATLVLLPWPQLPPIAAFMGLIERERLTLLNLPTAYWHEWVAAMSASGEQVAPSVRLVVSGGEQPSMERYQQWRQHVGDRVTWINSYGPTEATVAVTFARMAATDKVLHIGGPSANTRLYLLDAYGLPVPLGVAGELYIGGVQVARGYLNRPELTSERFVPDPFATQHGARMYRTGDLGRWQADGTIEFLGRCDEQVKIRGFRIEPGEIEARLLEHPGVHEAAVLAREQAAGHKRLVAYFIGEESLHPEALRAHLAGSLPEYMVPAAYVRLQALPLTTNGKLDRRALPMPEDGAFGIRTYEAPQGELEATLAALWAELLGVERIGRRDNFFELGGHSLLAVSLIERMRRRGWQLEVRSLFTSPTLAGLAATVHTTSAVPVPPNLIGLDCARITPELLPLVNLSQSEIDGILDSVPGGAGNVQDLYPLAPLQEGILFHHLLASEGDTYLMPTLLAFDSRDRLDRFLHALQSVIDRHDMLRTGIVWQGLAEPVQVVWRHAPLPVKEEVLDGPDAAAQLRARFDPRHTRIDLSQAPLLRAHVAHDAQQERWLLCLLMHHMVGDHTTLELMVEEVQAHLAGQAHRLLPPLPFRNFVVQARLGVTREQHDAFFTQMLGDIDEPTAPFGLLDVQGDGSHTHEALLPLPAELGQQLRAHARRLGVSAASLFHLAWALVLARTSGRDDVVFGTVLFGRMQGGEGAHRVLGMFLNTLPVRITLDATGVEQAVRATHARLAQLLHHEHAPLALAQRASGVPAPAPLFSALLNYRYQGGSAVLTHDPHAEHAWDGVQMLHEQEFTNYPLSLSVNDAGEDFSVDVQVDRRIDAERVGGFMLQALQQLAHALQHAPATAVRALDVLPAAERHQLVHGWNATDAVFPAGLCIHEFFEQQVARTPEATALVFSDTSLTYADLNTRANRLAHHLIALNVRPDDRVAIALRRGPEMVVALLATLKAGGAYVPLDPDYPVERLAFMLADSAPRVLLTEPGVRPSLGALPTSLPVLQLHDPAPWQHLPATNAPPAALGLTPRHLAYVIYTSGSTGAPKGVQVAHASVVNYCLAAAGTYALTPSDRVLQGSSVSFDIAVDEIFTTLAVGATLVLLPEPRLPSIADFAALIERQQLTVLNLPTAYWHEWVAALSEAPAPLAPSLRLVVAGGEAPSAQRLRQWHELVGDRIVWLNSYGPTETTAGVTFGRNGTDEPVHIGGPIANTRIYLLDAWGEPVPTGVAGEIHIGGAPVARGYLNRPDLTAERFVPDPFGAPGARLYRSGDLGRWRADGTIEFLGRHDHQVKIRGFRIEPGEIEARLRDHPDVQEAVVLAREDSPGDKRLVAYVSGETCLQPEALRAYLAVDLPEYMVPAAYLQIDALPLTPNGKLDRRALPAPGDDALRTRLHEAPRSGIEQALAKIWSRVLGVATIGREDHFFELGGHSLLAVRLVALAVQRGLNLMLQDVYACPTLSSQARRLAGGDHAFGTQALAARRGGTAPVLFAVPTGTGDITYGFELTPHLDADVPVYALPWPEVMPASMETLAAQMVDLMRKVRPHGPYRLLGYSSGGLLAYAVAQHLAELDEPVELVSLLDCDNPSMPPGEKTADELAKESLLDEVTALALKDKYTQQEDLQQAVRELQANAQTASLPELVALCDASPALRALAAQEQTSIEQFAASCVRAAAYEALWPAYVPQPLPAASKLHLFCATENAPPPGPLGWDRLLPSQQLQIIPVPGTHTSMIEPPHIAVLGRALSQVLSRIET